MTLHTLRTSEAHPVRGLQSGRMQASPLVGLFQSAGAQLTAFKERHEVVLL